MRFLRPAIFLALTLGLLPSLLSCEKQTAKLEKAVSGGPHITVYTTLDRKTAEPILDKARSVVSFKVEGVYGFDEAGQPVDLVAKLAASGAKPEATVFWGTDLLHALDLKAKGMTAPCETTSNRGIAELYKDPGRHWVGITGRPRVLAANTRVVSEGSEPKSILELGDPKWSGRVAMANPVGSSTGLYIAAIFEVLGEPQGRHWLDQLKQNRIRILQTDRDVARAVADGDVALGLTDYEEVREEALQKKPKLRWVLLDQAPASGTPMGTLIIPSTVWLIGRGPNTGGGRKVIEYLASDEPMQILAKSNGQVPLRSGVPVPKGVPSIDQTIQMKVTLDKAATRLAALTPYLKEWVAK